MAMGSDDFLNRPYGFFPTKTSAVLIVGTLVCVIPIALILWFSNVLFSFTSLDYSDSKEEVIAPSRWLVATLIPISFAVYGYRRRSVNMSGAVFGLFIGFTLALSSYPFLACLIVFFISGSQATKFRSEQKKKIEEHFHKDGYRNWVQVLCNSGTAALFATMYIIDCGWGETPVNFDNDYHASWLSMGVLGSFAAACGDTWASELGSVFRSASPVLITTFQPVPRGTNGGVSGPGLWFSFIGGMVIGLAHYVTLIYTSDKTLLERAPSQWPIVIVGAIAGFVGSVLDSYLGAIFQYSGVHKETGIVVDHPGNKIIHISGKQILDNHGVNLITNIMMGFLTPRIANLMWP